MTSRGGGDPNNSMASMPSAEWARRLGASPSKRMTASWSGSNTDPTEYKVAARCFAPNGRAPLGSFPRDLTYKSPYKSCKRCAGGRSPRSVRHVHPTPPFDSARQRSIADMTFSWPRLTWPAWDARQAGPRRRKMSATSTAGRDNGGASAGHLQQQVERARHLADSTLGTRQPQRHLGALAKRTDDLHCSP